MSKIFYDHLTLHDDLTAELDLHNIPQEEREEILDLIDEIYHHGILNLILSHLPKEHHIEFVEQVAKDPSSHHLLGYLKEKVAVDLEGEIKKHSEKLKSEIKHEIEKSRRSKSKS